MLPDAATQDLLYVSNVRTVTVYSYRQGKLEGKLKGFYRTGGECVDKIGDVFITNTGTGGVFEYARGGKKPLRILKTYGGGPLGCSVDPTTGNLAVSSLNAGSTDGAVAIYKNARGKPTMYRDSAFKGYYFCGYDAQGDLFVDGQDSSLNFEFAELPKGVSGFKTITLNQKIGWPGGVQWDGKYVAVGDQNTPVIYQFAITGSDGTKVGSTPLGGHARDVFQFFILGQKVMAPNEYFAKSQALSDVLFYKYPVGGVATKRITAGVDFAEGVVVSLAPSR